MGPIRRVPIFGGLTRPRVAHETISCSNSGFFPEGGKLGVVIGAHLSKTAHRVVLLIIANNITVSHCLGKRAFV